MPIYEFQSSDGQIYEIEAPDENAALQAFQSIPMQQEAPQENEIAVNPFADAFSAAGAGLSRGTAGLIGLPGTIADLGNAGGEWLMERAGLPTRSQAMTEQGLSSGNVLSSQSLQDALSTLTGGATDYRGQTTAGQYAGTIGEFLPGAAIGGLNPANLAQFGLLPAVASEAAGQWTEGTGYEPMARVAAALVAPAVPGLASRAISPFSGSVTPERQAAVDYLRSEGVNPTAGQITGSRNLLARESELGGARAADIMNEQARAFTDAAMRRAGGSGLADEAGMSAIHNRLSQGFRDVSSRNTMQADAPMLQDMVDTLIEYNRVLPSEQKTVLGNIASDIGERIRSGGGRLSGNDYQSIRSDLGKRAHNSRLSNPELSQAYRGLRDSLDNAMSRSVSPEDAATWARLRKEYGNMKVLEKAATGGGEKAALGTISPARLRQSAVSGRQGQYARGTGDFDQLARSGSAVLSAFPDSGTATRLNARTLGGFGGILGAGGGAAMGSPTAAMIGAAVGTALPAVAGRTLMSRPVQAYLTNQIAPNMSVMDPRTLNVIQSLLANQGSLER